MSAGRYNCEEAYNISSREGREGKDSRYDREIGVAGMGGWFRRGVQIKWQVTQLGRWQQEKLG